MDSRDRRYPPRWLKLDENGMRIGLAYAYNENLEDYAADEDGVWWARARYEVCGLCEGKGSHVAPGVDSHGISAQEFYEDPEFYEDYRQGTYDVPCNRCHGERVELVPDVNDDSQWIKDYNDHWFADSCYEAERRAGY